MANNEKSHMPALLKYVEVKGLPFKVSTVPKKRKPEISRKKATFLRTVFLQLPENGMFFVER